MDQQEVIDALLARLQRLEMSKPRRRAYNQQEAADRLNMSVSKLRALHQQGRGPRRRQNGRIWQYLDEDLSAYEQGGAGRVMTDLAPVPFNYRNFDPKTVAKLQESASTIRRLMKTTTETMVKIGMELVKDKDMVPRGLWPAWVVRETGMSVRTAQEFMQVARLASKSAAAAFLPRKAALAIASPRCPEAVRNRVLECAKAGQIVESEVLAEVNVEQREARDQRKQAVAEQRARELQQREQEAEQRHRENAHAALEHGQRLADEVIGLLGPEHAAAVAKVLLGASLPGHLMAALSLMAKADEVAEAA